MAGRTAKILSFWMMSLLVLTGCPEDSDPRADEDAGTPAVQCADGVDNDGDELIDGADPDCSGPDDDSEAQEMPDPQCSDGEDNDEDGQTDFPADADCGVDRACTDGRCEGAAHTHPGRICAVLTPLTRAVNTQGARCGMASTIL